MPGTWKKASPSGPDPRSLSRRGTGYLQQAEPHRHPSLPLGGFCLLQEQRYPPRWLESLTAIARREYRVVYPQSWFSGPTWWDRFWHGKPQARCWPMHAGPCLTTVVRTVDPALSSLGSVLRPDPVAGWKTSDQDPTASLQQLGLQLDKGPIGGLQPQGPCWMVIRPTWPCHTLASL